MNSELRKLPSVTTLLSEAARRGIFAAEPEALRTRVVRAVLDEARETVQAGAPAPALEALLAAVQQRQTARDERMSRRVINATGIPLHTNLGRAPLPRAILEKVVELGVGYCSLELDLATGQRGERGAGVLALLRAITGAEDALVANNGAAAVFFALAALAQGREVIVSRGELVQIGGGFRVPDILAASGARLVEVGTTNITTLADFERAVTPQTAMILRVHRSNFYVGGHTEEARLSDLASLAHRLGVLLLHDLGSGGFVRWRGYDAESEPTVQDSLRAGADLVTFSADKLVGGPQAGIIVGKSAPLKALAAHPLYRALRAGRLTLVALQEVLRHYAAGDHRGLTAWTMIEMSPEEQERRSQALVALLAAIGIPAAIATADGAVGGGAAPDKTLPTLVVRLCPADTSSFLASLRRCEPAVVPRVERDAVLVDLRTVLVDETEALVGALASAWG